MGNNGVVKKAGRPAKPENEKMVQFDIRVPKWLRDKIKSHGKDQSEVIRALLIKQYGDKDD